MVFIILFYGYTMIHMGTYDVDMCYCMCLIKIKLNMLFLIRMSVTMFLKLKNSQYLQYRILNLNYINNILFYSFRFTHTQKKKDFVVNLSL